jgi:hypothetical protein
MMTACLICCGCVFLVRADFYGSARQLCSNFVFAHVPSCINFFCLVVCPAFFCWWRRYGGWQIVRCFSGSGSLIPYVSFDCLHIFRIVCFVCFVCFVGAAGCSYQILSGLHGSLFFRGAEFGSACVHVFLLRLVGLGGHDVRL